MKEVIIDCWIVEESYDRDSKTIGYFADKTLAELVTARSKGYRSYRQHKIAYYIFESELDFDNHEIKKVRDAALAKLTEYEKKCLGLAK